MMRLRPVLAVAAAAALVATLPADAGVKTLDGKKTKKLTFALKSAAQSHDANLATDFTDLARPTSQSRPDEIADCPKTRCLRYSFVYAPAKGVKRGPFSVKINWGTPGQDYDLYVVQGTTDVGHCGASAGTSEIVVVPLPSPKNTYTVVIDQYRAIPDTVSGTISFPARDAVASNVPGDPDGKGVPVNCGL